MNTHKALRNAIWTKAMVRSEIEKLEKERIVLIDRRIQTGGHGRRARLQQQIDDLTAQIDVLEQRQTTGD